LQRLPCVGLCLASALCHAGRPGHMKFSRPDPKEKLGVSFSKWLQIHDEKIDRAKHLTWKSQNVQDLSKLAGKSLPHFVMGDPYGDLQKDRAIQVEMQRLLKLASPSQAGTVSRSASDGRISNSQQSVRVSEGHRQADVRVKSPVVQAEPPSPQELLKPLQVSATRRPPSIMEDKAPERLSSVRSFTPSNSTKQGAGFDVPPLRSSGNSLAGRSLSLSAFSNANDLQRRKQPCFGGCRRTTSFALG